MSHASPVVPVTRHTARIDARMRAVLGAPTALLWADGGAVAEDRLPHVRSASAVRRRGGGLVIVQDDVNALAMVGAGGDVVPLLLPAGEGGARTFDDERGNKHAKMDLEACAALPDGRLVAFGSGSTGARERLVVLDVDDGARIVDGAAFYRALRAVTAFSGSELNVEGAVVMGERLRLVQRGNGAVRGDRVAVDALGDVELEAFVRWLDGRGPCPGVVAVACFDLGGSARPGGGTRFTFTDATVLADGRLAFVACAEASPDTYRDGEVVGCRFGIVDGNDVRTCDVLEASGGPTRLKLEGIEARSEAGRFDVVVDMDRPHEPALLAELRVEGV